MVYLTVHVYSCENKFQEEEHLGKSSFRILSILEGIHVNKSLFFPIYMDFKLDIKRKMYMK